MERLINYGLHIMDKQRYTYCMSTEIYITHVMSLMYMKIRFTYPPRGYPLTI